MKSIHKIILVTFLMAFAMITSSNLLADTPPPPPSGGHGAGGNAPPGGGAPIGEGIIILAMLGAGYAAKKLNASGDKTD